MKQMLSKHTGKGALPVNFSSAPQAPRAYFSPLVSPPDQSVHFQSMALWHRLGEIMCCDFKSHLYPPKYELSATHVYYLVLIMM